MLASKAARIFHDWAVTEGVMSEAAVAAVTSSEAEMDLVQPVTDAGRQTLRAKQIEAIISAENSQEIIVLTKRAAPSKRMSAFLPSKVDSVSIKYRQGAQSPITGGDVGLPFGGPAYVVRQVGGRDRYTCGSSISVGNSRDAGTMGCLVRNNAGILHGLSNNHVSGACNFAGVGLPILAPGVIDVAPVIYRASLSASTLLRFRSFLGRRITLIQRRTLTLRFSGLRMRGWSHLFKEFSTIRPSLAWRLQMEWKSKK
jgi:hypothetical protein